MGEEDKERTGLAERERQDQEKAGVNRTRQQRQGVLSEESEEESEPESEPEAQSGKRKR